MQQYYPYQSQFTPQGIMPQTYSPYQTQYAPRQQFYQTNPQPQYQQQFNGEQGQPNGTSQTIVAHVNGIEGAKGYILFPNQTAILFDSDNKEKFYIKKADAQGVSSIENYKRIKEDDSEPQQPKIDYITKSDFEEFKKITNENIDKINALIEKGILDVPQILRKKEE